MFKTLAKVATFGQYGNKSDLEEIVDNAFFVHIYPRYGYDKKKMLKDLQKILGKNLEYVMTNFEGIINLVPLYSLKQCETSEQVLEWMLSKNMVYSPCLLGAGAKVAKHLFEKSNPDSFSFTLDTFNQEGKLKKQFFKEVMRVLPEYTTKSNNKKLIKNLPSSCPSCSRKVHLTYSEWEKIRDIAFGEDDDGDFDDAFMESGDGTCSDCGYYLLGDVNIDVFTVYKEIRAFEDAKGIQIFHKV